MAVAEAQQQLDGATGLAYLSACEVGHHLRLYSIPRTTLKLRFGLKIDKQEKWLMLIPKGETQRELHTHSLSFAVDAVPEPPAALSNESLEGDSSPLSFYLNEPYFLLSPEQEATLIEQLFTALVFEQPEKWQSFLPQPLNQDQFHSEVNKIKTALDQPDAETGMVFFRLGTRPTSYLIVRVTDKSKHDSLFVLTPEKLPLLKIYSIEGDGTNKINYGPLHLLALTIRRWVKGEAASTATIYPENVPLRYGLQYLQPFAVSLRQGYLNGLRYLSTQTSRKGWPVWYDFTNVNAKVSYSVQYEDSGDPQASTEPQFNFDVRTTVDNQPFDQDEQYKLIESRVLIRIRRTEGFPRVELDLAAPEFALSGDARENFLELAKESAQEIGEKFGKDDDETRQMYEDFIKNPVYRLGVVVLLSYRGKMPKEEFLVVWPGEYSSRARDFVFTCQRKDNKLEIDPVMRLEDDVKDVQLSAPEGSTPETPLSGEQYQAFHNFFHAVRIWRARLGHTG
jgi:hypothetical protein